MNKIEAERELRKIYMALSPTLQKALDVMFDNINELDQIRKKENFAENLRKLIKKKGFTQKEFANKCGISFNTLTYYLTEKTTPSLANLEALADTLEVSLERLVYCDIEQIKKGE